MMIQKKNMTKFTLFITAVMLVNVLSSGIPIMNEFGSSKVSAAKKTSGTQNMTADIKANNRKGRKMKTNEAKLLSSSSFRLFDAVIDNEPDDKNVLISPISILYAFGMAENGARGETRSQLENEINGGIKTAELNKILASTRRRMITDKKVSWNVANSVWYRNNKGVKVKKSFLKKVKSYYGAEVYRAPFNSGTVKDINSWVKKNTDKMIPKIIDRTNKSDVMYLINAMSFEGEWAEPFSDSRVKKKQDFTNIDDTKSKITMLTESGKTYFELNGAYGFKKNYSGGKYSFVGIDIPDETTPSEYIKKLSENGGDFVSALNNMKKASVTVKFPQFKTDYDVEMSTILMGLGVTDAFDSERADLYNMFEKDDGANYYFSAVLHKTYIEVDKKGTKAAAATAIIVNKTTSVVSPELEKIEITLDHPFVYAIVDNTTNLPVFIGIVNKL